MYYVCIENNQVTGIQSYSPAVPDTVKVITITDQQQQQIMNQTHQFDVTTSSVVAVSSQIAMEKTQYLANGLEREFLNSTDWQVLRHMRQKALAIPTTLTDAQYIELEQQRQAAAARIV